MNSNQGMIYLSGGGDETKTTAIDSIFLENLPGNNILFIPIAKSTDMNAYKKSCKWVTTKLTKLYGGVLNKYFKKQKHKTY